MDLNGDGLNTNDRAVVNGVPTTLDQFRGTPFEQVDLRISRPFAVGQRVSVDPVVELFNLFNRMNPGNNYVTNVAALGGPPGELANVQHPCLVSDHAAAIQRSCPSRPNTDKTVSTTDAGGA